MWIQLGNFFMEFVQQLRIANHFLCATASPACSASGVHSHIQRTHREHASTTHRAQNASDITLIIAWMTKLQHTSQPDQRRDLLRSELDMCILYHGELTHTAARTYLCSVIRTHLHGVPVEYSMNHASEPYSLHIAHRSGRPQFQHLPPSNPTLRNFRNDAAPRVRRCTLSSNTSLSLFSGVAQALIEFSFHAAMAHPATHRAYMRRPPKEAGAIYVSRLDLGE